MIDKYQLAQAIQSLARTNLQGYLRDNEIDAGTIRSIAETGRLEFMVNMVDQAGHHKYFVVKVSEPV